MRPSIHASACRRSAARSPASRLRRPASSSFSDRQRRLTLLRCPATCSSQIRGRRAWRRRARVSSRISPRVEALAHAARLELRHVERSYIAGRRRRCRVDAGQQSHPPAGRARRGRARLRSSSSLAPSNTGVTARKPSDVRRPAEVRLQHLADVHAARHADRVQDDVDGRAVRQVRHVLDRQDAGDDALVAVAAGHLVAFGDLAPLGDARRGPAC